MLLLLAIMLLGLVALRAQDMPIALVMALGLFGLAGNAGHFASILSRRPVHYLGKISFSIYLVQSPVLWLMHFAITNFPAASGHYWAFGVAATLAVIGVSHLTYTFIEAKFKNPWMKRQPFALVSGSKNDIAP